MNTASDFLDLWPSDSVLAKDMGLKYSAIRKWRERDKIPPGNWTLLVLHAQRRGIVGVTLEALAQHAALRRSRMMQRATTA